MSDNKVNNKLDFRNMRTSQFDRGQIEKAVFSELQSANRVYQTNNILRDAYTHFIQQTNVDGYPTFVEYYQATHPAKDRLQFRADSSGDLAGTYFILQEFLTKKTHVFWYNVSGSGSAPGVGDIETQIDISTNDPASVVAFATKQKLDEVEEFLVIHKSYITSFLDIEYFQFGETDALNTGTTGFLVNRLNEGESFKVGEISLEYDVDGNPIFNGNTLKGLLYNPYTASFDVERSAVDVNVVLDRPKSFDVTEISIPLADTETIINIPDGTKRFKLQARETNTKLRITNETSGDYFTLHYGCFYEENNLTTDGVVLYVESSRDNRTIELLTWS